VAKKVFAIGTLFHSGNNTNSILTDGHKKVHCTSLSGLPMYQSKTVLLTENGTATELLFALFSRMEERILHIFVNEVISHRITIKQ